jgi:hypothetical protein
LTDDEFARARKLIGGRRRAAQTPQTTRMPIEEGSIDEYQTTSSTRTRVATRREHRLVSDYCKYMEGQGDTVTRWRAKVGEGVTVVCDAFNETREQLIEAKSEASRADIRMAIGQLADYGRHKPRARRAVLLGERPGSDLRDLLRSQGVASIWPNGVSFDDDSDGEFTA